MENEKKTFLSWADNIWYHYKAQILLGIVALVIIITCSIQFFSKDEPDVFFYYVGQNSCSAQAIENFRDDMEDIMTTDYNGDGKMKVDYKEDIFVMYTVQDGASQNNGAYVYNQQDQMNIVQRFNMELSVGECVIYIMEPNLFKANKAYLVSLDEIFQDGLSFATDEKGIVLSELPAYRKTSLGEFDEDYVLCVRTKRPKDKASFYDANVDFFKTLVLLK